jgi:hypothetical protein
MPAPGRRTAWKINPTVTEGERRGQLDVMETGMIVRGWR